MGWDWKADLYVNSHRRGVLGAILAFIFEPSFSFVVWLRLFLYLKSKKNKFVRLLMRIVFLHVYKVFSTYVSFGISTVGRSLKTPHPHGIVIGNDVAIGNDVTILQNVTLGEKDIKAKEEKPTRIGNNVIVSAGAVVLGPINIGNDVVIGANSVVIKDLPDGVTAVGAPARMIAKHSPKK